MRHARDLSRRATLWPRTTPDAKWASGYLVRGTPSSGPAGTRGVLAEPRAAVGSVRFRGHGHVVVRHGAAHCHDGVMVAEVVPNARDPPLPATQAVPSLQGRGIREPLPATQAVPSPQGRGSAGPSAHPLRTRYEVRGTRAGSTGCCNAVLIVFVLGGVPVEAAAGHGVEEGGVVVEFGLGPVEVGSFGEPASEEAAGVLDEGFLPG